DPHYFAFFLSCYHHLSVLPRDAAAQREVRLAFIAWRHATRHRFAAAKSANRGIVCCSCKVNPNSHQPTCKRAGLCKTGGLKPNGSLCAAFSNGAEYASSPSGKSFRWNTSERNSRLIEKKWLHMNQFLLFTLKSRPRRKMDPKL